MHGDVVILHRKPGMTQLALKPVPAGYDLSDTFRQVLDEQERLCGQLESFADGLPGKVCWLTCKRLSQTLSALVRKAHRFEEEQVFPLIERGPDKDGIKFESLLRLSWEHIEDEGYAEEVAEALADLSEHPETEKAESLGYMLRGFFGSMRRHIAFEREYILPMIDAAKDGGSHA
ncbi:hemerythrin domain-containing protein [Fulvimarina sp. MAC3]|uniref:hemerythrin domain-containing protein n=1 Tax=Fulvimarina sp. MAC3 TaxID=3148887 RepID=UPI0031FC9359